MKALVFDVWGDFAHFRKFYTTSSPLTFSFPPPPTVRGMVAAILGLERGEYLDSLAPPKCSVAVRIVKPGKKVRLGLNYINTKGNYWVPVKKGTHEARTQIRAEFLRNPVFRIYFAHEDQALWDELKGLLKEHKTVFTLSLGLSELLANYTFLGETTFSPLPEGEGTIRSVLPVSAIFPGELRIPDGEKIFKETIPADMTADRVVTQYEDVVYEGDGGAIRAIVRDCWVSREGEQVYFF